MSAPLAPSVGRIVDHVVILVSNLEGARAAMTALGFAVLPRGGHPVFGTINHTIMLDDSYVELLAVGTPGDVNQYQQDYISAGGGLIGLSLATGDADATAARLAHAGIAAEPVVDFERPVDTAQGPSAARFRTIRLKPGFGLEGYAFFCAHLTPNLVWLPDRPAHANGASTITALMLKATSETIGTPLADRVEPGATGAMPTLGAERAMTIAVARLPSDEAAIAAGFSMDQNVAGTFRHPALGDLAITLTIPG